VLLGGLGLKMVWDNVRPASETAAVQGDPTRTRTLLLLAVATSIDALAVGISLAMTQANIWISALVIGSVTFVICCAGVLLGKRLGQLFQRRAGLVGGLVLVAIGIKILVEHISRGI
ncbi:MAG: manganese efflux pump MntP family protein, partial [Clostridia bacterium]